MATLSRADPVSEAPPPGPDGPLADPISQNIENVASLHRQEMETLTPSLRRLERASRFVGRPLYLVGLLSFVALWIWINTSIPLVHRGAFDPPPFVWLQGLLTLVALMTTTTVLIAQNRQTKLEQQRAHLDLQINLLTEQKVTKLIHLLEELRRDLPMVRDRHDPQSAALQKGADTAQMASALEDVGLTEKAGSQ
ncbi:MAG TPA: DUF1003 domain-containing protein [Steroidobacteraceae bacterium]